MKNPAARPDSPAAARRPPDARGRTAARHVDPLLRNGHLLTASSLVTAGVGAGYWALAARLFTPAAVGTGFAAVSAMMFLGGVGQLNLVNTMIRFVPPAGRRTGRLVARAYLAAAGCGLLLGAGFVLLVPRLSPGLDFLRSPPVAAGFAAATAAYALFVVQDGVLTGLRRADWVVLENTLFALVKLLLLVLFAAAGARAAILGSWGAGLAFSVLFTNTFIVCRAIPRHARRAAEDPGPPAGARRQAPTPGYLAADWTGSLCWLAATTLPPLIVLGRLGAAAGAYFSIAWLVAYALYQFAINMSASLIVEATSPADSRDAAEQLLRHCRRVLRHSGAVLVAAALAVTAAAPGVLSVFGPDYARAGTATLRLLALSALPNLVVAVAVAACRVQRRLRVVLTVLATQAALALGLTVPLLSLLGVTGAGLAWLVAQSAVAGALLWRRSWWLPGRARATTPSSAPGPATAARLAVAGLLPIRRPALLYRPVDGLTTRRLARRIEPARGATAHRSSQGRSDVLVFRLNGAAPPPLAVKHPRSAPAVATLAREWEALRRLDADPRLGEWRRLLPRPVDRRLDGPLPLVTQDWLPGVTADALLARFPEHAPRVAAAALGVLAELHRATGRTEHLADRLDDWVEPRRALLAAQIGWCRTGPGAEHLDALVGLLHRELTGRPTTVAWFHGDFAPGNVLLDEDGTRVTGVLDWGGARPDGPAGVDACTFVIALRARLSGRPWGALITDAVRAGSLSPADLRLLHAAGFDDPPGGLGIPLLAWLWHVTSNLEKSTRYGRSHWWVTANVVPVLKETGAVPEAREATAAPARWPR
ncbi:phosphotransferase [Streptomyces sp. SP17BM10]|uniref:phosphotransferase n=1 Tax=Streptomyces sp. SP17BM10 TaxID=3002530 RepID=UPI002E78DCEA|nr:phosphotransferase [Streptomyces sp. SP17BM10]MEE1787359.1 phosphotransferase [Streptomyces sp. SP17BM10]